MVSWLTTRLAQTLFFSWMNARSCFNQMLTLRGYPCDDINWHKYINARWWYDTSLFPWGGGFFLFSLLEFACMYVLLLDFFLPIESSITFLSWLLVAIFLYGTVHGPRTSLSYLLLVGVISKINGYWDWIFTSKTWMWLFVELDYETTTLQVGLINASLLWVTEVDRNGWRQGLTIWPSCSSILAVIMEFPDIIWYSWIPYLLVMFSTHLFMLLEYLSYTDLPKGITPPVNVLVPLLSFLGWSVMATRLTTHVVFRLCWCSSVQIWRLVLVGFEVVGD